MQKYGGKYDEALKSFRKFNEFLVSNDLHEDEKLRALYKQTKVEIDGCQIALNQQSMVIDDHGIAPLQSPINSQYSDYAAFSANDDDKASILY